MSRGKARRSTRRPEAGDGTSKVAPSVSTSTRRSPSKTKSPCWAYQTLSVTVLLSGNPSSGRVIGVRMARHHLVGVVARPHERPRHHLLESQPPRLRCEGVELLDRDVTRHGNVLQRRRQVLPQRERVAPRLAEVGE